MCGGARGCRAALRMEDKIGVMVKTHGREFNGSLKESQRLGSR